MATKALPSPEVLRQLLRYEPETGKLFWRRRSVELFSSDGRPAEHACRAWNNRYADKEAFTATEPLGYRYGAIFGLTQRAHRVAWAIQEGEWPSLEIDHIDGNPTNNMWSNLRQATRGQNNRNVAMHRDNRSGIKGIYWHKRDSLWGARICVNRKNIPLGFFKKAEDAAAAYAKASAELHGEFGRLA